jgi:hypothetical protein
MFRAAIRPSRQRSTARNVRSSQADLDICTGHSCLRTHVSGSWHRSYHCRISFWFHVKVFFTIAAYDRGCDPLWRLRVHLRGGARWTRFLGWYLRFCSFFPVLRSWKGDQMLLLHRSICRFPFRQSSPKSGSRICFRSVPTRFLELGKASI